MGYSKYVGRVGALALALGIGTAVATPAWAESPNSDTESSTTETRASRKAPSNKPSVAAGNGAVEASSGESTETGEDVGSADETEDSDSKEDGDLNDESIEEAGEDEALEATLRDEDQAETTAELPVQTSPDPEPEPSLDQAIDAAGAELEPTVSQRTSALSEDRPVSATRTYALPTNPPPGVPAPAPLVQQPKTPVGLILGGPVALLDIAGKAISMLFNPDPSVPGDPPLLLGVLAFVRREIQRTFFNSSPDAVADIASTSEGVPTRITVLGNDIDPNIGDVLTITNYTQSANGAVTLNSDGSFTYTPKAGFSGTDTFTYTISDDASDWHSHGLVSLLSGHNSTATVTVTVAAAPINQKPTAGADSASVTEDGSTVINVLANDTDPDGDTLAIIAVTTPTHGTATITDGKVTYTGATNYHGTDAFTYTISDGVLTATASVTVTVTSVNDVPVAVNDAVTEPANAGTTAINVLANDSDPDTGDTLNVTVIGSPSQGGTASINADKTIAYKPAAGFSGTETFSYTISDGTATTTATVTVTVTPPVNATPVAYDNVSYYTTNENTTLNVFANDGLIEWDASDADGDELTAALVAGPINGTVDLNPDGSFTYTPNFGYIGSDSFAYTVSDGTLTSNTATVGIVVTPAGNRAPSAYGDSRDIRKNGTLTVPIGQGLLSNRAAYNPDGGTLTAALVSSTSNGQVIVNPDGSYTYTPNTDYVGWDSFTYTVSDGEKTSDTATVTITVHAASQQSAPEAYGDSRSVSEGTTLTVAADDGLASPNNAFDNEGDSLTVVLVAATTNGQVIVNADGSYTYTPNSGYIGEDSFTYRVSDGQLTSDAATVTIEVQANSYSMETGIALGPDGKIYVLYGNATYSPQNGSTNGSFHIASRNADGTLTELVQLDSASTDSLPTGLAVASDGRFLVVDHVAGSVTSYDPNNSYAANTIALIPSAAGIAVDSNGRIYVTTVDYSDPEEPSGQLWILDSAGTQIGQPIELPGPSVGVAVAPNGDVYVVGLTGGLAVYHHRALQTEISADDLPGSFYGVAVGADGTAHIANREGPDDSEDLSDGSVLIVDPADPTKVERLTGVSQPWGITVANGLVYVTELDTRTVVVLDPANATEVTGNTGSGDLTPHSTDVETAIALGADGKIYALHGTQTFNPEDGTTTSAFRLASQNADGTFTDLVSVGNEPTGLAIDSAGRIYVTDYLAGSVTVYDPNKNYSATTIASVDNAAGIAISGTSGRIYVTTVDYTDADQPSGQLVILSSAGTQIGQRIDLAGPSAGVAVGPGGNVYVTGLLGGLAVYNSNGVLQTSISAVDLPGTFYGVAVGADGRAYIANRGSSSDSIAVVNPGDPTNILQFTGVTAPWGVILANGRILVSSSDTQTLVEFDQVTGSPVAGNQVAASTKATLAAAAPATSAPASAQMLATPFAVANAAVTASTSTGGYTYSTISLGGTPTNVTLSANGARGFVVVGSQVKIIDVGASTPVITNSVNVGSNPYMVAVNSFGTRAYVTNSGNGTVSIIEKGTSVSSTPTVTTLAVGSNPTGIALNSNGTRAYVANSGSGTVSIINYGSSTPITVAVGSNPIDVAVNSAGTIAYVTNSGGSTVSIIKYNGTGTPTVTTVAVSARPQSVKTSDNGNKAIVYSRGGYVAIIDASGSATQVPGVHPSYADYPGFTAMSGDGSTAFVTEHDYWRVSVIDTSKPGATPQSSSVSDYTHSIVSLPNGSQAFTVAHDALWVVDSKTLQSVPVYVPVDNNSSESQRIAISSDGKRVIAVSNNGDLTAFYLSGAISTHSAESQWWRTDPSTTQNTASKDATGTVTSLLAKITKKDDRISIDKIVGSDGKTRLAVYISGVGGNLASQNAFLNLKAGANDPAVSKAINRVVELNGNVHEIMLVGFSKGGSAAQVYAASGKYGGKNGLVTTVVTFASPLVKKAMDYPAAIDVLNLEAVNDYIPRDEFVGSMFGFVDWDWRMQASNRGVRQTFDSNKTDWKTIYIVDTEAIYQFHSRTLAQVEDQEGHNHDNYYVAAREYEQNAYRWEQSRRVIDDIRRFKSGSVTHVLTEEPFHDIDDPFWGPDLSLV